MTTNDREAVKVSDERLAEMLVGVNNHGGAKLATIYTADYASALSELQQRRASVVTPESVFDESPNVGATTSEPSLRKIVQHYYKGTFSNAVADDLTARYFAALSVASHEAGDGETQGALPITEETQTDDEAMTPEEVRLENLKQMAKYDGPIVSFDFREPYYLASCDRCGWVGSSELCGTDSFGDDSDVYCPRCHASGADCGKVAAALPAPTDEKQGVWRAGIERYELFSDGWGDEVIGLKQHPKGEYVKFADHISQLEAVERERDTAQEHYLRAWNERDAQRRRAEAAEASLAARTVERDAMREALAPFAALYAESMRDFPDGSAKGVRPDEKQAWGFNNADISWGDFRRAALAAGENGR